MASLPLLRRRTAVLLLLLSSLAPPFFLERPHRRSLWSSSPPQAGPDDTLNIEAQRLLLSPTFLVHFFWIICLLALAMIGVLDLTLRAVYTGCKIGVERVTSSTSLPPNNPRYIWYRGIGITLFQVCPMWWGKVLSGR